MPHRKVQDEGGRWWDVWDTRPTIIDRRAGRDRRSGGRGAHERRQKTEPRVAVEPQFRDGWLAFQSGTEWRRLAPIPEAWDTLTDRDLLGLLAQAAASAIQRV
jgi:phage terminase small subunit